MTDPQTLAEALRATHTLSRPQPCPVCGRKTKRWAVVPQAPMHRGCQETYHEVYSDYR